MDFQIIMSSEVKPDCYSGETHDQIENRFDTYCLGDKESDTHKGDLTIRLAELPPGARVIIKYPCCSTCGIPREQTREFIYNKWVITGFVEECSHCGFDWNEWVLNEYS